MRSLPCAAVVAVLFLGTCFAPTAEASGVNGRVLSVTAFTPNGTYGDGLNFLTSPSNTGNFQEIHWSGTGFWGQVFIGTIPVYTANWGTPGMGPHGTYIGILLTTPTNQSLTVGFGNNSVDGSLVFIGQ